MIARSLIAPRPHVSRARAGVPPALDGVVVKALSLEPSERYPDMASMRSALRAAGATPSPGMRWRVLLAGRVKEVREALQELTRERPGSP